VDLGTEDWHGNRCSESVQSTWDTISVRFVKNSISSWSFDPTTNNPVGVTLTSFVYSVAPGTNIGVWQKLSTRAGAEVVSADSY
jgi:hypothetical protein